MPAKTYLRILKIGIFASFLTFFFLFSALLFPYITSKQLAFNILIEALMVFWLLLIIKYPEYRPKKSYITYGLIAYFVAILLSCVVSVDFNLSFWSNAERMLGFFHLLHFFFFYLILITVMRTPQDWKMLLDISVAVAVITTGVGLSRNYPASDIGNVAYVAAIMIFNFFFIGYLWTQTKNLGWRIWYALAMIFVLIGFWQADISGAQAGLVIGLLIFGILSVVLNKNKKVKLVGWSVIAAGVLILGILWLISFNSNFGATRIGHIFSDFSTKNVTLNTRLLSWKAGYQDFGNHPFFGTGYGNYAATFDKYFDPHFYDYSPGETYFDRAHNNLVDITSTTGALGLLTYLSIFAAIGYYLIRAYRKNKLSLFNFAWLTGLVAAYFVQNLAVFDALVTYICLFAAIGLIHFLTAIEPGQINEPPKVNQKLSMEKEFALFVIFLLFFGTLIYKYNVRGFKMFSQVITGYNLVAHGQLADGLVAYKAALADATPFNRDSRSSLVNLVASNPTALNSLSATERNDVLDYVIGLAQANVAYNSHDSLMELQLAQIANVAARANYQDLDKLNHYSAIALEAIDTSIESSPGRVTSYFIKADINLTRGEKDEAINDFKTAIGLKENFADSHCEFADIEYFLKDFDTAYSEAGKCVEYGGVNHLQPADFIQKAIVYQTKAGQTDIATQMQSYLDSLNLSGSSQSSQ